MTGTEEVLTVRVSPVPAEAVSVVPVSVRLVPIISDFTEAAPSPIKIPVRVDDPVPPPIGKRMVAPTIGPEIGARLHIETKSQQSIDVILSVAEIRS